MEINKSILLCSLVLLAVVAKETIIQVDGTKAEKDNTCLQQGNLEGERTVVDHKLFNPDQVGDGNKGEENIYKYLLGFDQFDSFELKTNDAGQPRYPEIDEAAQPRYPETDEAAQPRYPETNDAGQPRYPEAEDAGLPTYEYPPLTRRDPGKVGDTQEVEYSPGQVLKLITRAVQPPVFEIPEFLTPEECDNIIQLAKNVGLKRSRVYGTDIDEEFKTKNIVDVSRVSDQARLNITELGDLGASLINRIASIAQLPQEVIERSEDLQVANYKEGGHFHAHLDSSRTYDTCEEEEGPPHTPCCFQMKIRCVAETPNWETCCRLCRYITVMYYLSDVPAGGETAFPIADIPEDRYQDMLKDKTFRWSNLSYFCYNASLILRPKKGTAIMWYNHHVDPKTRYLGLTDNRSYHGGCDVLTGSKWIATTWISTPPYLDRLKPSLHYKGK